MRNKMPLCYEPKEWLHRTISPIYKRICNYRWKRLVAESNEVNGVICQSYSCQGHVVHEYNFIKRLVSEPLI